MIDPIIKIPTIIDLQQELDAFPVLTELCPRDEFVKTRLEVKEAEGQASQVLKGRSEKRCS